MPRYGVGAEGLLVAKNADQIIQQIRLSPKCNDVHVVRSGDGQTLTFRYEALDQQAAETISSEIHSILDRFINDIFGRSKPAAAPPPEKKTSSAVKAYQEAEFIFTKRIEHLERKIAKTSQEAAEAHGYGRKTAAITHLRRRKLYQSHIDHLVKMLMILESQRIYLESGTLDAEVMTALKTGTTELKSINQHAEPQKVDKLMDEIKDLFTQNDSMSRQLKEAFDEIGSGGGAGSNSDEAVLEEELNALAQEQHQQPSAAAAAASSSVESLLSRLPSVPVEKLPTTPARQRSAVMMLAS